MSRELEELRERQKKIDEENEALKEMLGSGVARGKGKNKVREKKKLTPLDRNNLQDVNHYLKQVIWPNVKILPRKWSCWSANKKSLCQRVMAQVTCPACIDPKLYWNLKVRDWVNEKWTALKANLKNQMRKRHQGESVMSVSLPFHFSCMIYVFE
jgi:hypothetical protein